MSVIGTADIHIDDAFNELSFATINTRKCQAELERQKRFARTYFDLRRDEVPPLEAHALFLEVLEDNLRRTASYALREKWLHIRPEHITNMAREAVQTVEEAYGPKPKEISFSELKPRRYVPKRQADLDYHGPGYN